MDFAELPCPLKSMATVSEASASLVQLLAGELALFGFGVSLRDPRGALWSVGAAPVDGLALGYGHRRGIVGFRAGNIRLRIGEGSLLLALLPKLGVVAGFVRLLCLVAP